MQIYTQYVLCGKVKMILRLTIIRALDNIIEVWSVTIVSWVTSRYLMKLSGGRDLFEFNKDPEILSSSVKIGQIMTSNQ